MDDVQATEITLTPQHLEVAAIGGELTEEQVAEQIHKGCALGIRAVIVRPSDLDQAARIIQGPTLLAAACDWPDGAATTSTKVYGARDSLRRGAREIHAVLSVGKLNSRQFQYVEMELIQLAQACHESGAKLRVILQTPLLTEEGRLVASKIAKRSEVDSVIAAVSETPAEHEELLLRKCLPLVQVCGVGSELESVLGALNRGCFCINVSDPAKVLGEWNARQQAAAQPSETAVLR